MRLHILKLFLLLIIVLAFTKVKAQDECTGSFGDPVIKEDFGSGAATIGPPFPYTSMTYTTGCPGDGSYARVNNTNISNGGNCHTESWQVVTHDHTYYTNGDPNGYMMMINATQNSTPTSGVFFTEPIDKDICASTKYEFSAYFLNLISTNANGSANYIKPNITFTIQAPDGTILGTHDTGDLPTSANGEDWIPEKFVFDTKGYDRIVLIIQNNANGGGGNDLLLDDIQFRACGPLVQGTFASTGSTAPQSLCKGIPGHIPLAGNPGTGYTNPKLQWQQDKNDGNGWVDIAGANDANYTTDIPAAAAAGDYKYRLAEAEGDNINYPNCRVYSGVLTVTVYDYPVKPTFDPQNKCEGDALSLSATGGITYTWAGPGVTDANKNQNPFVIDKLTAAAAGNYTVTVYSAAGCPTTSDPIPVSVLAKPLVYITNPETPLFICKGQSAQIGVASNENVTYLWHPAAGLSDPTSATPTATPTDTTTYTVVATNANGCIDSAKITINVLPPPTANAGGNKKIFEGQSTVLNATAQNANTYSWSPVDYLDNPNSLTPTATPPDDQTYTLTATSSVGCGTATSSVFIKVYKKIDVPNTFSPNGDGTNDTWNIEALVTYPQSTTQVFNRYGQVVFKCTGYDKPWRGTYNGKILPEGTYYYVIDLKNGAPPLSGWVLIVK